VVARYAVNGSTCINRTTSTPDAPQSAISTPVERTSVGRMRATKPSVSRV
jgi:hypothetical protein